MKPAGNFRRITNGPSFAGLPRRTAAWAPGGSDGGAGPHATASPETTVWCMSPASIWDVAARTAAPIVKAMAIERDVLVMMISSRACFAAGWMLASPARDDDLEVVAGHHHRAVAGAIEASDERQEVVFQRGLLPRLERREGLQHRAVIASENLHPVLRRAVAEGEASFRLLDRRR